MLCGFVPNRVRYRIAAIAQMCDRLAQRQRRPFGIAEIEALADRDTLERLELAALP
jgi:hypothetical protein